VNKGPYLVPTHIRVWAESTDQGQICGVNSSSTGCCISNLLENALSDEGSRFRASHPTPQGINQGKTREAPALGRQGFGRRDLAEWGLGGLFKVRKIASCFPWSDRAVFVLTCPDSERNPIELSFCTGLGGP
jgi:hypothetical protein